LVSYCNHMQSRINYMKSIFHCIVHVQVTPSSMSNICTFSALLFSLLLSPHSFFIYISSPQTDSFETRIEDHVVKTEVLWLETDVATWDSITRAPNFLFLSEVGSLVDPFPFSPFLFSFPPHPPFHSSCGWPIFEVPLAANWYRPAGYLDCLLLLSDGDTAGCAHFRYRKLYTEFAFRASACPLNGVHDMLWMFFVR